MLRLGVTGGIGSGKSLVCSMLENMSLPVYYADQEARGLMNNNEDLKADIIKLLGQDAYRNGELDRKNVAAMVFGNPALLKALNSLVHPVVRSDFDRWSGKHDAASWVVEEAALLFESGAYQHLDLNVLVYAPVDIRMQRVILRDELSREEVEKRMSRQMDDEKKRELADEVLINDGKQLLLPQVVDLYNKLHNWK